MSDKLSSPRDLFLQLLAEMLWVERMLVFRDWLLANEADRELYARAKGELAQKEWKYVQNYADAKTDVIQEILARAQTWKSPANRAHS